MSFNINWVFTKLLRFKKFYKYNRKPRTPVTAYKKYFHVKNINYWLSEEMELCQLICSLTTIYQYFLCK